MKILRLDLIAFGPFTQKRLRFEDGRQGLHLVYGANEAGKSAALRALSQMLFGIPLRSTDDFVHPYHKLRIGGCLCKNDGKVLDFIRRKGRRNTLRESDDVTVIEASGLREFLGGIDHDLFATMFGIDHDRLVRGGEEIIRGEGEVGRILFAAGAGISDIRHIQNDLQTQADDLFKPSARKPVINATALDYENSRKEMRAAQLNAAQWVKHDKALRDATVQKQEIESRLAEKLAGRSRLERIREALPLIAARKELQDEYQKYTDIPLLSDDFSARRQDSFETLRMLQSRKDASLSNIAAIEINISKLDLFPELLENADTITALFQELGSIRKAAQDRIRLESLRHALTKETEEILYGLGKDMTVARAEDLRVDKKEYILIQDLGDAYQRMVTRCESTQDEIDKLVAFIARLKQNIAKLVLPPDTKALENAVATAQEQGNLEERYLQVHSDMRRWDREIQAAFKKMPLWHASLEKMVMICFPSVETIDIFEDRLKTCLDAIARRRAEKEQWEAELVEISARLQELSLAGEIPTESDLRQARNRREDGWRLIKKRLANGEHSAEASAFLHDFPTAPSLPQAYEHSVREADDLSDRLRREADRVAQKATFSAADEKCRTHLKRVEKILAYEQDRAARATAQWHALWQETGLTPQSPREMRAWVQRQSVIAEQSLRLDEKNVEANALRNRIETCRRDIIQCLAVFGQENDLKKPTLARLVALGRETIEQSRRIRTQRRSIEDDLAIREAELRDAQLKAHKLKKELSTWRSRWKQAVQPLGLAADISVSQANAIIEDLKTLFGKRKEMANLDSRIRGIDRDAEFFTRKVKALIAKAGPDIKAPAPEQAVIEINLRLGRAQKIKTTLEALEKQSAQEKKTLLTCQKQMAELHARLDCMCEEAGCQTPDALMQAEKRSARKKEIQIGLAGLEERICKYSAGQSLTAFIEDVQTVDADVIESGITGYNEEIDALNRAKSEQDQIIGQEGNELKRMDGSAKAAGLAEQSQAILACLESHVQKYVCLCLAQTVLAQAVEKYREKNQGPILRRANDLFARMTLGSFQGLRLEFGEKNEPVLVGVRPGGTEIVHVAGMSDGTADQLYLAIRLASLESFFKKNEPMPFIVDDILIQFDDHRAKATLEVLAKLSEQTQVIFFTHHRHLVSLAKAALNQQALFIHEL
jgi:uncharacterized protein YhaN